MEWRKKEWMEGTSDQWRTLDKKNPLAHHMFQFGFGPCEQKGSEQWVDDSSLLEMTMHRKWSNYCPVSSPFRSERERSQCSSKYLPLVVLDTSEKLVNLRTHISLAKRFKLHLFITPFITEESCRIHCHWEEEPMNLKICWPCSSPEAHPLPCLHDLPDLWHHHASRQQATPSPRRDYNLRRG